MMQISRQDQYWLWLASIDGIGSKRFQTLLEEFTDIEEVWEAARENAQALEILGPKLRIRLHERATHRYFDTLLQKIARADCRPITMLNPEYPRLLREIYDPPAVLFVRGGRIDYEKTIAVVGTRACSRVGRDTALHIGEEMSNAGINVVSGLARGIDTWAHIGAMKGPAPTIAVLGCGPDIVYPQENRKYYDAILEHGGAIVSEYLPGTLVSPGNFPARNRIISGICRAVVVVESPMRSGTMITVSCAQEQGRDVFSVPGSILVKNNEGTNALLRECAYPYTKVTDVLEEYGWNREWSQPVGRTPAAEGTQLENTLAALLAQGEMGYEELLRSSALETKVLNSTLTMMELKGIIRQYPGKIFALNR